MKKPADKKPAKKKPTTIPEKMLAYTDEAVDYLHDLIDRYELDHYLDGHNIKGSLVDESEEITPEQVAILGGYTTMVQLRDNLIKIKEGKKATKPGEKSKPKATGHIAIEVDGNSGEAKLIDKPKLPKEVRDALRKLLDEGED